MLVDGNLVVQDSVVEADVCIVGAGAAGISVASEFIGSRYKVVLLESGGFSLDDKAQRLNAVESEELAIDPLSRIRQLGGTTTVWAGKWIPFTPYDLEKKNWVAHSGWPLRYEELIPYYKRASALLQGPSWDQFKEYYDQAARFDHNHSSSLRQAPIHWLASKNLEFSQMFAKDLKGSQQITVFLRSSVVSLRLKQNLESIEMLRVRTLENNHFQVKSKFTVLACGGIENARLLLASNQQQICGVANENDNVGRYYMNHPKGEIAKVNLGENADLPGWFGLQDKFRHRVDAGLRFDEVFLSKKKLLNTCLLLIPEYPWSNDEHLPKLLTQISKLRQNPLRKEPYLTALSEGAKTAKLAMAKYFKAKLASRISGKSMRVRRIRLQYYMEQVPNPENRVQLSENRDQFGNPIAKMRWTINELERKTVACLHEEFKKLVERAAIGQFSWLSVDKAGADQGTVADSSHHMGTTRMGDNPKLSVVDVNCRAHSVNNLYIAGSSVFPTGGFSNPTFTIAALAIRLADKLKVDLN